MITEDDVRKVFEYMDEYSSDYEGCSNCIHQPEPMRMCEWGENRNYIELICSRWEKKRRTKQ